MTTETLVWILIPANIPIYLFLGWVVFDDARNASHNFVETLVAIGKAILIPRIIRIVMGDDSDATGSMFNIVIFLGACIAAVAGEYYLITRVLYPTSFLDLNQL